MLTPERGISDGQGHGMGTAVDLATEKETVRSIVDDFAVCLGPGGFSYGQEVNGFKEVRLALTVVPNEECPRGMEGKFLLLVVPEIREFEVA